MRNLLNYIVALASLFCALPARAYVEDPALDAQCAASLRSLTPEITQFHPVEMRIDPVARVDDAYQRLALRQLRRYLAQALPEKDVEQLSLANAILAMNGLSQSYDGGAIFNSVAQARGYAQGLVAKYATDADIAPPANVTTLSRINVCFDTIYKDGLAVRGQGTCWVAGDIAGVDRIAGFETLASPEPECRLPPPETPPEAPLKDTDR